MTKHCLNLDNTLSWYSLICGNPTHQRHQCAIIKRKALSSQSKGDSLRDERPFIGKVKAILQIHDSLLAAHRQNTPSPIDYSSVFP
jgi:hypothetical protein